MDPIERRIRHRGRMHLAWDALYAAFRFAARHATNFYTALGIVLVAGAAVSVAATWMFVKLADVVSEGATQAFDEAVLRWMSAHQVPWAQHAMFEITLLGTGLVLMTMVAVAGTFLWLTDHRFSALLLLIATWGGVAINWLLKSSFNRPRPQVFEWGAQVLTSSFPSGHAMTATITYGTVAYLAARLQRRRLSRWITLCLAGLMIILICVSRLYLGVHYPSDVVAGALMGLAWTAFCMATLEAIQIFGRRFRPEILEHEDPPPAPPPAESPTLKSAST
jgi:undecaprenyl-diphosphatase